MKFFELTVRKPNGDALDFKSLEGKVVLIVNTATKCGLAPQFDGLEQLHQKYKEQGLVVLGFPCDQFAGQEPETNETVEQVCKLNFGVTFQLTEKVKVNGMHTHPVFKYLKSKLGGWFGSGIKWNFTKFVVDKQGRPVKRFSPTTTPEKIEQLIVQLLQA
jgi:glutathione peroxidase